MTARQRLTLLVVATVAVNFIALWLAATPPPAAQPPTPMATAEPSTTAIEPPSTVPTVPVTAPKVAPETVPHGWEPIDLRCPEWRPILVYVGFSGADLTTADRILWRESRCLNEAVNMTLPGGTWCGFQIHRNSWQRNLINAGVITDWADLSASPVKCAAAAYHLVTLYGWRQWSTY